MAKPLLPDALGAAIEPARPPEPPTPQGGRPRVRDRAGLTGRRFVLRTGMPWELLAHERGCGAGMTGGRRLCDGPTGGVGQRVHRTRLDHLGPADRIAWTRARVEARRLPAPRGRRPRPDPHRSRPSRRHAPPGERGRRRAPCRPGHPGERPRRRLGGGGRPGRTRQPPARPATETAGPAACRPGRRPPHASAHPAGARHHPPDRPPGGGVERTARAAPLGGGTDPGLAGPDGCPGTAGAGAGRTPRRPPSGVPRPRLCAHLLDPPPVTGFDRHASTPAAVISGGSVSPRSPSELTAR